MANQGLVIAGFCVCVIGVLVIAWGGVTWDAATDGHDVDWHCADSFSCIVDSNGNFYGIYYSDSDSSFEYCLEVYAGLEIKLVPDDDDHVPLLTQTCFDRKEVDNYIQDNTDVTLFKVGTFWASGGLSGPKNVYKVLSEKEAIYVADLTDNDWAVIGDGVGGVFAGIGAIICCCCGLGCVGCASVMLCFGFQQPTKIVVNNVVSVAPLMQVQQTQPVMATPVQQAQQFQPVMAMPVQQAQQFQPVMAMPAQQMQAQQMQPIMAMPAQQMQPGMQATACTVVYPSLQPAPGKPIQATVVYKQ